MGGSKLSFALIFVLAHNRLRRARVIRRAVIIAFGACTVARAQAPTPVSRLADAYVRLRTAYDPTLALSVGLPLRDSLRLPNRSQSAIRALQQREDALLAKLQALRAAEITAVHETIPGHHLQIAMARRAQSSGSLGAIVFNAAYVEGWANYAERLTEEQGIDDDDFERIQRRVLAGRSLVIDPGIHVFGWTRARAEQYAMQTGMRRGPPGTRQASLFLASQAFGSQSSTLLPSGSMIHAKEPFSADSGPETISTPSARSWSSISPRLSTR